MILYLIYIIKISVGKRYIVATLGEKSEMLNYITKNIT